jgi:hypothetical protein
MALFVIGGLCIGYVNIVAISWLQARTAPEMMGRVMSIVMLVGFGISPLSMAVAGALIDLDSAALFLGAGALVVGATVVAFLLGTAALFDAPAQGVRPVEG